MKFKESSLTDIIAAISAVALVVTMASQTYFYYRLDALWLLSILPPSVFFIEVLRVLALVVILILGAFASEAIYKLIIKLCMKKRKILYKDNADAIKNLLDKKRKSFVRGYAVFSIVLLYFVLVAFQKFGFLITTEVMFWTAFTWGSLLKTVSSKELNNITRRVSLVFILICTTALNAEIKIAYINTAPIVFMKSEKGERNEVKLLDMYQDKVIVFYQNDSKYEFNVLQSDQIEKIVGSSIVN
ncbi:hypothetical protein N5E66_15495 [Acinetobacter johnsonii]|uniref:hypothetical protein n=1 Tax=Acinetobacter TaxID=469 RepID=UPI0007813ED5|nr:MULTISPECIES: hypothetical protein [Acinetobacter]MDD0802097.1 hypothetical protein [Acinetobacter sp. Gutcm_16]MDH1489518.1 hypothetical protein [Acinetobacter johnsonii]MDH1615450.1 hypothetical protein [Acinetobacter johnsonii]NKG38225.1 hypothetical protein [Acinetobacter johnsonii]